MTRTLRNNCWTGVDDVVIALFCLLMCLEEAKFINLRPRPFVILCLFETSFRTTSALVPNDDLHIVYWTVYFVSSCVNKRSFRIFCRRISHESSTSDEPAIRLLTSHYSIYPLLHRTQQHERSTELARLFIALVDRVVTAALTHHHAF